MSAEITFGTKIKMLRLEKGYTSQEAFAKAVGVSRVTINYYENDARKPDYEIFAKIADVLGVPYDYLFGKTTSRIRKNINIADRISLSDEAINELETLSKSDNTQDVVRLTVIDELIVERQTLLEIARCISAYVRLEMKKSMATPEQIGETILTAGRDVIVVRGERDSRNFLLYSCGKTVENFLIDFAEKMVEQEAAHNGND